MEKSNQQPKPEDCPPQGDPVDLWYYRTKQRAGSVSREKREPQAGPASCLSNSASKVLAADGEAVRLAEPNTEATVTGKVAEGLPGSKSVARAEEGASNEGGPNGPCRTNCEGQAGREAQRQGAPPFVACFAYRHEADKFEQVLRARLAKFGSEVAADKTKTLRFGSNGGSYNGRFDFLGFEFYWEPDREGRPRVKRRTATKRHLGAIQRMTLWVKEHRDQKLADMMRTLRAKLQGTWNYYGLIGKYAGTFRVASKSPHAALL